MKVLHVLSSNIFSGAENVACQIIKMFEGDIEMFYSSPDGDIPQFLRENNIIFLPIKKKIFLDIKEIISHIGPDIIHAHDIKASVFSSIFSGKIPVVSHIHCNFPEMRYISLKSLIYRISLMNISKIIIVSKSIQDEYYFRNSFQNKCTVLPNVIDGISLMRRINDDKKEYNFDVIFIGRLSHSKNPERLIRIFKRVVEAYPMVKMGIIGSGELDSKIRILIHKMGIEDNVELCGYLKNPIKALSQSKVMLMTSRSEGTPMAALEALLLGVPIVSTSIDGLRDIIVNNKTGFLCNNDSDLVNSICYLLSDKEALLQFSANSKIFGNKINDIGNYRSQLITIYNSCIGA